MSSKETHLETKGALFRKVNSIMAMKVFFPTNRIHDRNVIKEDELVKHLVLKLCVQRTISRSVNTIGDLRQIWAGQELA